MVELQTLVIRQSLRSDWALSRGLQDLKGLINRKSSKQKAVAHTVVVSQDYQVLNKETDNLTIWVPNRKLIWRSLKHQTCIQQGGLIKHLKVTRLEKYSLRMTVVKLN